MVQDFVHPQFDRNGCNSLNPVFCGRSHFPKSGENLMPPPHPLDKILSSCSELGGRVQCRSLHATALCSACSQLGASLCEEAAVAEGHDGNPWQAIAGFQGRHACFWNPKTGDSHKRSVLSCKNGWIPPLLLHGSLHGGVWVWKEC